MISIVLCLVALVGAVHVLCQTVVETPLEIQLGKEQGITHDTSISADTLQKILAGVEAGNKDNIYFYGLLKLYGISMVKDVRSAAEQFLRASKLGHAEATTAYGVMKLTGTDTERKPDYSEAVRFFREGVKMNDMNAHWLLAKMLVESKGVPSPNYVEASLLLLKAVPLPQACHLLGVLYEYGLGVRQDYNLALKYYRIAAEQKHVEAIYHLALMHAYGRGDEGQDLNRAKSLFFSLASVPHPPSCYYLGIFSTYGYAGKVDYEQAVMWFELAAGGGDVRVEAKAREAALELRRKIDEARAKNEEILDVLQDRADKDGSGR